MKETKVSVKRILEINYETYVKKKKKVGLSIKITFACFANKLLFCQIIQKYSIVYYIKCMLTVKLALARQKCQRLHYISLILKPYNYRTLFWWIVDILSGQIYKMVDKCECVYDISFLKVHKISMLTEKTPSHMCRCGCVVSIKHF